MRRRRCGTRRLIDERIGLNRAQCRQLVAGTEEVLTRHVTFYADHFTDLDAWTPLSGHDTAARLDGAATVFWGRSGTWDGILDSHRDGEDERAELFDVLARFRTGCRPILTDAAESTAAARRDLDSLADDGVRSRSLGRALRTLEGELDRLSDGRTTVARRAEVASRGRRLHAEAEDIRCRLRAVRPRLAVLTEAAEVG
ncbi:hypothetical protein OG787_03570 [Streptomyces sp. NBC_00075]|uniref:hypothetical protein n=1 Tax=Streptomyces sp. NBC_00075 TaxID=2975641 RepID=UPI0032556076